MSISLIKSFNKVIKSITVNSKINRKLIVNINKNHFTESEDKEKLDKIEKIKEELKKQTGKLENEEEIKITDFFKFMDENIQKETELYVKNKNAEESNSDIVDDVNELLNLVKCPITEDNLEACEEGLKISVIFKFLLRIN